MLKKCTGNQKDSCLRRKYSNCHSIPQCFFWMPQTLWNKKLFSCCCDLYLSLICTFLPCLDTVLHIGHKLYWIYFKIYCCPISKKLDGLGLALSLSALSFPPLILPPPSLSPQVATVSERSRIMELEREVAELQLRLRSSQQTGGAVSLSPEALSNLKARAQSQEKKVGGIIVLVKKTSP